MSRIWVARRANRVGLYLPMGQVKQSPSILVPLTKHLDKSELDELVRSGLEKQGVTKESEVQSVVDEAEKGYELRVKTQEASKEVRRLLLLKSEGKKLMQVGHKKWKEAHFRPINKEVKDGRPITGT
jgi:hypothetical protein